MNIQIFHNLLWSKYKGGVFSALHNDAQRMGHEVEFVQIATTEADRVSLGGIDLRFHRYPFKLLFDCSYSKVPKLSLYSKIISTTWRSAAELSLSPGFHSIECWLIFLISKIKGRKFGFFCDSTFQDNVDGVVKKSLKKLLKRFFIRHSSIYFCYGIRSSDYLRSLGALQSKIVLRCQAAALPIEYTRASVLHKRTSLIASMVAARFLFVGRLSIEKDIDVLLKSFARVVTGLPNAELVIVGEGPDRLRLQSLVSTLKIDSNVIFAGSMEIDSLAEEYVRASCLVLPSFREPWGLVVNEALSFGCPAVVSNNCGCCPELVIEGVTGYSFSARNIDELTSKMKRIWLERGDAVRIATNCMSLMDNYTPSVAAHQILKGCLGIEKDR